MKKCPIVFSGSELWKEIKVKVDDLFEWSQESTYIHHPPCFQSLALDLPPTADRFAIGESTVRTQVVNLLDKLHLANRVQATL